MGVPPDAVVFSFGKEVGTMKSFETIEIAVIGEPGCAGENEERRAVPG